MKTPLVLFGATIAVVGYAIEYNALSNLISSKAFPCGPVGVLEGFLPGALDEAREPVDPATESVGANLGASLGTYVNDQTAPAPKPGKTTTTNRSGGKSPDKATTGKRTALPKGGDSRDNMRLGEAMAARKGWTGKQWDDLKALWARESGWQTNADNPTSSAYGIPQILTSYHSADWFRKFKDDPAFQIKRGLNYIRERYGNPSAALQHSDQTGWY